MINIQTPVTTTSKKYFLFISIFLLSVLSNPIRAQHQKSIYVVVRSAANAEMLSMIQQSLVREGFDAEFTNQKYNEKHQLTGIRMVVKQGNRLIGKTDANHLLEQPLVFYFINNEKMGLTRGYPKDLSGSDRRKINNLHGFMVTDGTQLEIHGKYKSENLEVNGKYKSNE